MTLVHRVLNPKPVDSLDDYITRFAGGTGLRRARACSPDAIVNVITDSGLRGRGGAGFPTGKKWRTVLENRSAVYPTTVIVNAAEGEPGTFKDRTILRCNPYAIIEGALIAARTVGATRIIFATKKAFTSDVLRLRSAIAEIRDAGWASTVDLIVFEGPNEYLYGEETALLETLNGRPPFPRIAPPFRRGLTEVFEEPADYDHPTGLAAHVEMAGANPESSAPPALIDNVETLANIAKIITRGAAWFRTEGTEHSPGTVVCTITGRVRTPGVGEVLMGTTLREAIDEIGGGPLPGFSITAVMPGVSAAIIPADHLDTPLTYEDMTAIGSGLGSAGFWVLDESIDPVAAVAGASRFLAIESCGQCTPCKQDGLTIASLLDRLAASDVTNTQMDSLRRRANTVAVGARCSLGVQHQQIVAGLFAHFADAVDAHQTGVLPAARAVPIAELVEVSETAVRIDERHQTKQPDWTHDATWSGKTPVERHMSPTHAADDAPRHALR
jgi:NADH-quinone oxidoreductase subunit F